MVCNAAEGEPGTFKDRWLIRHNPYAVLEGVLIAAHAAGARSAYVALKASFAREIARLTEALAELQAAGALGEVRVPLVRGPEEYLFGEEKALLEVIEGNDPLPQQRRDAGARAVDRPARGGLVREVGTRDTPGTLLFTVSGDVCRPGVYERPAGITLRELFHEVAGGPREGRKLKAALSGVSVAPIAAERFDTPADFGSLALIGSGLGSAGFIVYDDAASMPRVAQMAARSFSSSRATSARPASTACAPPARRWTRSSMRSIRGRTCLPAPAMAL